jgi:hypothetical protein
LRTVSHRTHPPRPRAQAADLGLARHSNCAGPPFGNGKTIDDAKARFKAA